MYMTGTYFDSVVTYIIDGYVYLLIIYTRHSEIT